MKLRVGLLSMDRSSNSLPGPSQVVWEMAKHLANLEHEVHLIAPGPAPNGIDPRIHVHLFQLPPYGYRWVGGHVTIAAQMTAIARRLDLDVVHAAEYLSTAVATLLAPHMPVVLTVPGNIFQRLAVPDGNQASYLYTEVIKWAARQSARRCKALISFSREMVDWWERTGAPAERQHLIPYGVDTTHFAPAAHARARLGISADALALLYVGRLDREKGVFDLLDAFRELPAAAHGRTLQLHIVGGGVLRGDLERAAGVELGRRVFFHGPATRDDLPHWYSAADALVLPSWVEPFGRVIIEAFACGTPALATRTGGPVDLVTPGETGYLFEPRDAAGLRRLLGSVVTQPDALAWMGERARRRALAVFDWEQVVRRIVDDVYAPIVDRGQTRPLVFAGERQR